MNKKVLTVFALAFFIFMAGCEAKKMQLFSISILEIKANTLDLTTGGSSAADIANQLKQAIDKNGYFRVHNIVDADYTISGSVNKFNRNSINNVTTIEIEFDQHKNR